MPNGCFSLISQFPKICLIWEMSPLPRPFCGLSREKKERSVFPVPVCAKQESNNDWEREEAEKPDANAEKIRYNERNRRDEEKIMTRFLHRRKPDAADG